MELGSHKELGNFKDNNHSGGYRGSIIVWRLGGFGLILDAEYGCCRKIIAVYDFCIATRLQKI